MGCARSCRHVRANPDGFERVRRVGEVSRGAPTFGRLRLRSLPVIGIDTDRCAIATLSKDMRETGSFPIWNGASFLHETERGELRMWLAAPTTLVMQYRGYSDAGYMDFVEDVWARTLEGNPERLQIFADTEHQTGFAHGFRTGMVSWNKRIVERTNTYCLLVKSRWVAMGIAIVRATLGGPSRHVEVTTSRDVFHSRLDATVRRFRPRYELIIGAGGAGSALG